MHVPVYCAACKDRSSTIHVSVLLDLLFMRVCCAVHVSVYCAACERALSI